MPNIKCLIAKGVYCVLAMLPAFLPALSAVAESRVLAPISRDSLVSAVPAIPIDQALKSKDDSEQTGVRESLDASKVVLPQAIADIALSGPLVQGGLLIGQVDKGDAVSLADKSIFVDAAGQFVIGLDRDAPDLLELKITRNAKVYPLKLPVRAREYNIQRIEGVEQKYVAPNPDQQARSRRDISRVVAARKQLESSASFENGFEWPSIGPISGVFGSQRVYNGVPKRPHYGVDIAREVGAEVLAPAPGVVRLAEDLYFSGLTIILDHGHYLSSSFLHLSKMSVEVGDRVLAGQKLGEIGATGRVTGPHLDWRMNWVGGNANVRIDPELLVPPMQEMLDKPILQK